MTLKIRMLTIMNEAILTAKSTNVSSPTLRLNVTETFSVLAGGEVNGKWLEIIAQHVNIESSGKASADGLGMRKRSGSGSSSGRTEVNIKL